MRKTGIAFTPRRDAAAPCCRLADAMSLGRLRHRCGDEFLVCLVVQGSAAEWCKAGAEDDAGVDEISVGDDALVQRLLRFDDQGLHQLAAELFQLALGPR